MLAAFWLALIGVVGWILFGWVRPEWVTWVFLALGGAILYFAQATSDQERREEAEADWDMVVGFDNDVVEYENRDMEEIR
jgi:hypothetical protein